MEEEEHSALIQKQWMFLFYISDRTEKDKKV